jgi:hypothetical protein
VDPISATPTVPRDYALLNVVWAGAVAGLLATTRARGRDAPPNTELPVLGLASFALTKALAKEKVGSWVRDPFVEEDPGGERRPRGERMRFVIGELITCTRCLGTWSSLGVVGLRVARPREGRIVAGILAAAALNDVLQSGFSFMAAKANETAAGAQVAGFEARSVEERLAQAERSRAAGA